MTSDYVKGVADGTFFTLVSCAFLLAAYLCGRYSR